MADRHQADWTLRPACGWTVPAPLFLAAILSWAGTPAISSLAITGAMLWGAAALAYLAGVRRGLAHGSGDAGFAELLITLVVFALAIGSMLTVAPVRSLALLILGFAALALLARRDRRRAGTTPAAALVRLGQMGLAAASLLAIAARLT